MLKYLKENTILFLMAVSLLASEKFTDIYILPKQFFITISIPLGIIFILLWRLTDKRKPVKIKPDIIDYLFFLFTIYLAINYFSKNGFKNIEQEIILSILYFSFYFIVKQALVTDRSPLDLHYLLPLTLMFPLIQSLYGIIEYIGIIEVRSDFFKLGGSFGNPGPYSNFIVATYPLSFGLIMLKKKARFNRWQRIIIVSAFIFSTVALLLSQARTAWISACFGALAITSYKYGLVNKVLSSRFKWAILTGISIVVFVSAVQLYQFKKGSSLGRMFIWELSLKSIADKPVFGHGFNKFAFSHNNQQARFFENNPDDIEKGYFADNALFAFNDYLEICIETGIVGMLMFVSI